MQLRDLRIATHALFFGLAILAIFYLAANFLIPFFFAAFLAALVAPVSAWMENKGLPLVWATLLSTLMVFLFIGGISYTIYYQLSIFAADLPQIRDELEEFLNNLQQEITSLTGLSLREQQEILQEHGAELSDVLEAMVSQLLGGLFSTFLNFLLVLVYIFLLLLNRNKYIAFVLKYVGEEKKKTACKVLGKGSRVVHHYLWGRLQVMIILSIMYIITFLAFGVPYAVLLTIFGAMVTIIPYIGPFLSGILPVLFMSIFGASFSQVLFFGLVILVIQLIESYVLEPVIIGKEVQLSPLAIIVAIIIGGMLWNIPGMILFVPLFAIIKIIADHTTNLKPIGFLIGNDQKESDESYLEIIKNFFKAED